MNLQLRFLSLSSVPHTPQGLIWLLSLLYSLFSTLPLADSALNAVAENNSLHPSDGSRWLSEQDMNVTVLENEAVKLICPVYESLPSAFYSFEVRVSWRRLRRGGLLLPQTPPTEDEEGRGGAGNRSTGSAAPWSVDPETGALHFARVQKEDEDFYQCLVALTQRPTTEAGSLQLWATSEPGPVPQDSENGATKPESREAHAAEEDVDENKPTVDEGDVAKERIAPTEATEIASFGLASDALSFGATKETDEEATFADIENLLAEEGFLHPVRARRRRSLVLESSTRVLRGPFIYLKVEVPVSLTEFGCPARLDWAKVGVCHCAAVGDPPPVLVWSKDGKKLVEESREGRIKEKSVSVYVRSELRFNATQTGNYTCIASNTIQGQSRMESRSSWVEVLEPIPDTPLAPPNGYCGPYNGKICKAHLNGTGLVWFNISHDQAGGWLNEQLVLGLWEEVIQKLSETCRQAAERFLCLLAFPQCRFYDGYPAALPLCYEDCMALRHVFCANEWTLLDDNKQKGIFLHSRGHFRLPECGQLPKLTSRPAPQCSNAKLVDLQPDQVTYTCVRGRGRYYQGNVSVTRDGLQCQNWSSQSPHPHTRPPPGVFPEMANAENYCRNAGGEEPMPWCYTTDPNIRWQHCSIPYCEPSSSVDVREMIMDPALSPSLVLSLAAVGFASLLLLLLVLFVCQKIGKHTAKKGYSLPPNQKQVEELEIDLDQLPCNSTYHRLAPRIPPELETLEFPRNNVVYIRDLGQGAFGRVFQAKAPGLIKGEAFTTVAVKTLKDEADETMEDNFQREACLLAQFDHPNIIRLLGVCAVGKPLCLLLEYMGAGDLNSYLRSCTPSNYIVCTGDATNSYADVKLSPLELVMIARQIAAGMVYLAERGFVHRDLATRNCLVNEEMAVKIADFGLSQQMLSSNYYKGTENDAIPIRWMPLESILHNRYTTASDVWAFGVCLWEVFSFAVQPYYGMTHEEVVRFVTQGGILDPPTYAPCAVYAVMKNCFASDPAARPTFAHIYEDLLVIEEALARQKTTPSPTHV